MGNNQVRPEEETIAPLLHHDIFVKKEDDRKLIEDRKTTLYDFWKKQESMKLEDYVLQRNQMITYLRNQRNRFIQTNNQEFFPPSTLKVLKEQTNWIPEWLVDNSIKYIPKQLHAAWLLYQEILRILRLFSDEEKLVTLKKSMNFNNINLMVIQMKDWEQISQFYQNSHSELWKLSQQLSDYTSKIPDKKDRDYIIAFVEHVSIKHKHIQHDIDAMFCSMSTAIIEQQKSDIQLTHKTKLLRIVQKILLPASDLKKVNPESELVKFHVDLLQVAVYLQTTQGTLNNTYSKIPFLSIHSSLRPRPADSSDIHKQKNVTSSSSSSNVSEEPLCSRYTNPYA